MKQLLSILIFAFFISCNSKSEEKENFEDSTVISQPPKPVNDLEGCYMKVNGRDTAILVLKSDGDNLSGKMIFDNYQYDGSSGTVSGRVEGEIIKIWYDFLAEGMHSVMEIYFKKEDGRLLRGMGDIDVKSDTSYYKYPSSINFPEKEIFERVDCALVNRKF
jgi:hypothetical protein